MMCRLKEFDLINEIESFTGIIMGSSAGAMIQIAEYHITPHKGFDIFSYNRGLNLIKDLDIEVYYKETEREKNYINKVLGTIKKITSPSASLFPIILRRQIALIGSL